METGNSCGGEMNRPFQDRLLTTIECGAWKQRIHPLGSGKCISYYRHNGIITSAYTGRREATRNNCRSLAVMVNFCGSHHRIWTRSTTSGAREETQTLLLNLQ